MNFSAIMTLTGQSNSSLDLHWAMSYHDFLLRRHARLDLQFENAYAIIKSVTEKRLYRYCESCVLGNDLELIEEIKKCPTRVWNGLLYSVPVESLIRTYDLDTLDFDEFDLAATLRANAGEAKHITLHDYVKVIGKLPAKHILRCMSIAVSEFYKRGDLRTHEVKFEDGRTLPMALSISDVLALRLRNDITLIELTEGPSKYNISCYGDYNVKDEVENAFTDISSDCNLNTL